MEIPHDILLEMLKICAAIVAGVVSIAGSGLLTARVWFKMKAKSQKTQADVLGTLLRRFDTDVKELKDEGKAVRARVDFNSEEVAKLSKDLAVTNSNVKELLKNQPHFLGMMEKFIQALRKQNPSSEVQPLAKSGGMERVHETGSKKPR